MGKTLDAIVISLFALFFGSRVSMPISEKMPPTRLESNLRINTSRKYYQVVQKDEEAGIKDLKGLLNEGKEESWIYLPQKKEWHETGEYHYYGQKILFMPVHMAYGVSNQREITNRLMHEPELIFYHIHPSVYFGRKKYLELAPSAEDLRFLQHCSEINPNVKSRIVSRFGVTTLEYLGGETDLSDYHSNILGIVENNPEDRIYGLLIQELKKLKNFRISVK